MSLRNGATHTEKAQTFIRKCSRIRNENLRSEFQKTVHTLDQEPTVIVTKSTIHPRIGHEGPEGE
jgi:hypothetical protein